MAVDHRQLGVDLFNHTWSLLDKEGRTTVEDDELLNAAYASAYHWSRVGAPENFARSQWQLSRVNAVLGRAEPALYHAQRCLDYCLENGIEDWDRAFAYEALARAHRLAGNDEEARRNVQRAREIVVADEEDREHLEESLATV